VGVDFKGKFRMGDGRYCYPLTVMDTYSRFVLGVVGMH
jgi:transposase InsO family protein